MIDTDGTAADWVHTTVDSGAGVMYPASALCPCLQIALPPCSEMVGSSCRKLSLHNLTVQAMKAHVSIWSNYIVTLFRTQTCVKDV